jgi:uncharacterized protein YggE
MASQVGNEGIEGKFHGVQLKPGQTVVSVTGHATEKRQADEAHFIIEVETSDPDERTSHSTNRIKSENLDKALLEYRKRHESDIWAATNGEGNPPDARAPNESYVLSNRESIETKRDYQRSDQPITGYTTVARVEFILRRVENLDKFVSWIHKFGDVTRMDYSTYLTESVAENTRLNAYINAVRNARLLAINLAEVSGFRLTELLFIEQQESSVGNSGGYHPRMREVSMASAAAQSNGSKKDLGVISVSASVSVKYLCDPFEGRNRAGM